MREKVVFPEKRIHPMAEEMVPILKRLCALARIQIPDYSLSVLCEEMRGFEVSRNRLQRIGFHGRALEFFMELFRFGEQFQCFSRNRAMQCNRSSEVGVYLIQKLGNEKRECFYVLYLDYQMRLIHEECLFKGGIHCSLLDLRLIFHEAIKCLATKLIVAHNHPSGKLDPSEEDIQVTKRLIEVGHLLEIEVLDHFIVTQTDYYSFKEHHLI